jgi:hypothetical protein
VLKFVENVVQFLLARWAGLLISGVKHKAMFLI